MLIKYYKLAITLFLAYLSVVAINFFSPMQSDDFAFYLNGLSFDTHWHFYNSWSGRFIVDYWSTAILAINNHLIIALINSLALPLLIYTIATLPYYEKGAEHNARLVLSIIILWIAYWLSNPALGQATFWIVGSANYLWPLVFVSLLLKYLLKCLVVPNVTKVTVFLLALLSVFSGCSNEATGALVLYCLVLLYAWAWFNKLANRAVLLMCFVIAFVSYLFLLLAPGNMVRAASPAYAAWRVMALDARVYNHFYNVIPSLLKSYGIIYLLLIWAFAQSFRRIKRIDYPLLGIWLSAVLVFCVILIASPHATVPRTYVTGLFFLLIGLSFLLKEALQQAISRLGQFLLIILYAVYLVSYVLIFSAYYSINKQSQIRFHFIDEAKRKGEQQVVIPNYYRDFVLREGDFPELDYHNPGMMGRYYGMKEINVVFADFDYATLLDQTCETSYHDLDNRVQCIYTQTFLGSDTLRLIVKFDPKVGDYKKRAGYFKLQVKNTLSPTDPDYYDLTLPLRITPIGGDYFASADVLLSLLGVKQNPTLLVSVYSEDTPLPEGNKLPSVSIQVK